jgi:hypothetical protein
MKRRKWWVVGLAIFCGFYGVSFSGPLDANNWQRFEYHMVDGVNPPLTVYFGQDRDTLLYPIGASVYLPKSDCGGCLAEGAARADGAAGEVQYRFHFQGKAVTGTIPQVPSGEWHMEIGPDGIVVHR